MQIPQHAGVPLDDLIVGRRYEIRLRERPGRPAITLGGMFVRLRLRRGQAPLVVFALAGGREKAIFQTHIESIHAITADGTPGECDPREIYGDDLPPNVRIAE